MYGKQTHSPPIGLFFLSKVLRKYSGVFATCFALLAIAFGTNYFNYVVFEPGMPHGILFSFDGILLYIIDKWYEKPTAALSILIGLLYAEICLIRPAECVSVVVFLLYGLKEFINTRNQYLLKDLDGVKKSRRLRAFKHSYAK